MGQIFISYRRSDASGHAGRLRDRLRAHFGENIVFQDVDNIPDGEEFAKVIERALDSCSVALVIMGRNWVNAESTRGVRRFDDPDDWVRTEVGILLRRGIRVVPVLVQGASMPRREDLPEELRDLAGRNARELRDSAWDADISLLLKSLEPVLGFSRERRRKRNMMIAAGAVVLAIAGLMYAGLNVNIRVGEIVVPDLEGKTVEMAREVLAKDGFKNVHEAIVSSADFGKGRVVRTEPVASTSIASTDRVTVFVSGGVDGKKVPSGQDVAASPPDSSPKVAKADNSTPAITKRSLTVQAKESWQYSGANLAPGDEFEINAAGRWSVKQGSPEYESGAEGIPGRTAEGCNTVLPGRQTGALAGKVGDGPPFLVGRRTMQKAATDGPLMLMINDCPEFLADNLGGISVEIVVRKKP